MHCRHTCAFAFACTDTDLRSRTPFIFTKTSSYFHCYSLPKSLLFFYFPTFIPSILSPHPHFLQSYPFPSTLCPILPYILSSYYPLPLLFSYFVNFIYSSLLSSFPPSTPFFPITHHQSSPFPSTLSRFTPFYPISCFPTFLRPYTLPSYSSPSTHC